MQQLQHKKIATLPTGRQMWNELPSLPIRNTYVVLSACFVAFSDSSEDKIRPGFNRYGI